jgi:hypothetical protein
MSIKKKKLWLYWFLKILLGQEYFFASNWISNDFYEDGWSTNDIYTSTKNSDCNGNRLYGGYGIFG